MITVPVKQYYSHKTLGPRGNSLLQNPLAHDCFSQVSEKTVFLLRLTDFCMGLFEKKS